MESIFAEIKHLKLTKIAFSRLNLRFISMSASWIPVLILRCQYSIVICLPLI